MPATEAGVSGYVWFRETYCVATSEVNLCSTQMEEAAPDRKPGKVLSLYIPAALGVLSAALSIPYCESELTWPQMLMGFATGGIAGFFSWWIAVMVCFHGYHFVRAVAIVAKAKKQ